MTEPKIDFLFSLLLVVLTVVVPSVIGGYLLSRLVRRKSKESAK